MILHSKTIAAYGLLIYGLCLLIVLMYAGNSYTGTAVEFVEILSPTQQRTRFHYISTLYRGSYSEYRFQEIVSTVQSHVDNPLIMSVHLLVEEGLLDQIILLNSSKVTYTVNPSPTYKDFFTIGNSYGDGLPIIVGNADVEFGPTLACILPTHLDNTAMVISRHPSAECWDTDSRSVHLNRCTMYVRPSHDAFIYRAPLSESVLAQVDHPQNVLGSEVKVIEVLRDSGMKLTNPCFSVIARHNHCTRERNYATERVKSGKDPALHVPPSSLPTCPSTLRSLPGSLYYGQDEGKEQEPESILSDGFPSGIKGFKDVHAGERCVIIGNGPSLNSMNLTFLNDEISFGTNLIYLGFERFGFKSKYYVSVNKHVITQNFDAILENCKVPKFLPDKTDVREKTGNMAKARGKGVYLLPDKGGRGFSTDVTKAVYEGHTVTFVSMQLAYYMGCQEVVLIGVDHRFSQEGQANKLVVSDGPDPNHFDPNYFGKGVAWQNADLQASEASYQRAKDAFEKDGRTIVDATVGGALTIFPKRDYTEYFNVAGLSDNQ